MRYTASIALNIVSSSGGGKRLRLQAPAHFCNRSRRARIGQRPRPSQRVSSEADTNLDDDAEVVDVQPFGLEEVDEWIALGRGRA